MRRMATTTSSDALTVVTGYFDAISRQDLDAIPGFWAPDGVEHIDGQFEGVGGPAVRDYFARLWSAFPDFKLEVDQTVAQDDRVAVHWHATATFAGPGDLDGIRPNGARVRIEGIDLLRVENGVVVRNDAYVDGAGLARQIGVLPPKGSGAEQQ